MQFEFEPGADFVFPASFFSVKQAKLESQSFTFLPVRGCSVMGETREASLLFRFHCQSRFQNDQQRRSFAVYS